MKIRGKVSSHGRFDYTRDELIENGFTAGQEIWGLRYTKQPIKSSKGATRLLQCYPVKGVLAGRYLDEESYGQGGEILFFVPYGRSGKLSFSKAVDVNSRQYATTKEEAIELYNENIQAIADMYEQMKLEVLKDKV